MIKRFCKGVAIIKSSRLRYDYVWDPALVIAKLSVIYLYDLNLKTITTKLVILLAFRTGHFGADPLLDKIFPVFSKR